MFIFCIIISLKKAKLLLSQHNSSKVIRDWDPVIFCMDPDSTKNRSGSGSDPKNTRILQKLYSDPNFKIFTDIKDIWYLPTVCLRNDRKSIL